MKWFQRERAAQQAVVAPPLTGPGKSDEPPRQAPPLLTAGGPPIQRIGGEGDQVTQLTTGKGPVILDITHTGAGHFVVDALDGRLHSQSQLVYTDGPFSCRALVNADDRPVRALRIQADGPWTVDVRPVSSALPCEGHTVRPASDVLRHTGGPGIAALRYEGDPRSEDGGYFLVDTFEPDGSAFLDELANHVGPWHGEAPLAGPCLIHARSDGPWSITVRPLEQRGR
ncbi:hypothetical protein [Streptomyces stelliscabiei]|uniref:hypothetical protein n=1 Tax=Streptomyces stelliscabiei TaxID=146820 RepID=UPI0029BA6620|nr:hypothetical protein [Streptomyces stelliscabiei]MDX2550935.1 hypothetical protein [Streptomyces stelliscabiei]MDX2616583.1 hypothetical protein [Streptomyces stelliscabiei]MDX2635678.1 hypothetical protein [Streptomyces stelliscabiei]MDX2664854.1 hypothetical protein [Streptomyces stelliscabiei]MDX2714599.1 hypothetical protein [Streptomyces stelliscabiei]